MYGILSKIMIEIMVSLSGFYYLQAPEQDVEGVVLHVGDAGLPTAVICHGQGSFDRTLREFGEPLTVVEPAAVEETGNASVAIHEEAQPEAATV